MCASLAVMSLDEFKEMGRLRDLKERSVKLRTCTGELVKPYETTEVEVSHEETKNHLPLLVVKGNVPTRLGWNWLKKVRLEWREAYSSFEGVSTDHRIVTVKIRLSLRKNAKRTATTKHYDWALLNNKDIRDKYVLELRNRFETLQEKTEKSTPNDEYENFVNAHLEAAAKYIPTKIKTKYRVPWETLAVREKRALVKTASKNYRKNPTNTNALKLKTAQYQLAGIYIKEQTEYIQNQIDKIRDSVEDRQSRIAWQTINEVSRRKNTAKAKLKAANQQERIKLWKQHFENLLGNPPKITHEPITRIISKQLDIKLGPFTQEELDSVLRKIKNRKAAGLDEIPPEVWKTRQFDDILLRHCNVVYNQNPIDRWMKGCILPFPKKGDLGLAKNYRGITLTSIAAKIYNALLRNRIEPKIDNILRKTKMASEEIDPQPHKY